MMQNACFRCRTSLPSGETFCPDCWSEVSLEGAESSVGTRWWIVVAATTGGMTLGMAIIAIATVTGVMLVASAAATIALILWFGFLIALAMDAHRLKERDEVWSPPTWLLAIVVVLSLLWVLAPLAGAYYLYVRRSRIGLG